jgi:hypothetical protein
MSKFDADLVHHRGDWLLSHFRWYRRLVGGHWELVSHPYSSGGQWFCWNQCSYVLMRFGYLRVERCEDWEVS